MSTPLSALRAAQARARVAELEAEVAVLSGTACAEEQAEGNGPCGACRTCRNKRIAELEAENAKLRACVEAADAFFLVEDAMSNATEEGVGKDLWIESQEHRNSYDAARAEVGE